MTETIKEMMNRLALEANVDFCLNLINKLENEASANGYKLLYDINDLANGFNLLSEIQAKQLKDYNKELEETPEVRKPEPKPTK